MDKDTEKLIEIVLIDVLKTINPKEPENILKEPENTQKKNICVILNKTTGEITNKPVENIEECLSYNNDHEEVVAYITEDKKELDKLELNEPPTTLEPRTLLKSSTTSETDNHIQIVNLVITDVLKELSSKTTLTELKKKETENIINVIISKLLEQITIDKTEDVKNKTGTNNNEKTAPSPTPNTPKKPEKVKKKETEKIINVIISNLLKQITIDKTENEKLDKIVDKEIRDKFKLGINQIYPEKVDNEKVLDIVDNEKDDNEKVIDIENVKIDFDNNPNIEQLVNTIHEFEKNKNISK